MQYKLKYTILSDINISDLLQIILIILPQTIECLHIYMLWPYWWIIL